MCGGIVGTTAGMMSFSYFSDIGKISTIISLLYMNLLAIVGALMLVDTFRESRKKEKLKKKLHDHNWFHGLTFQNEISKI